MSRKGFLLFIAAGLAWGVPYLFIRVAVEDFSTPTIVFSRVLVGALVLVPLAIHRKSLLPALKAWRWVLAFAVIEMVGPWWLLTEGEREINSGLAGLLILALAGGGQADVGHGLAGWQIADLWVAAAVADQNYLID